MQIKTNYIIASTFSFLIHASLILFFVGYFYSEKKVRPVLNNPIDVSLIFEQDAKISPIKNNIEKPIAQESYSEIKIVSSKTLTSKTTQSKEFEPTINTTSEVSNLIKEEINFLNNEQINNTDKFSLMIIDAVEGAWLKPKNIQDGLVCDLRIQINKNGRIINVSLLKSSGNIRFDNSAIKAVKRVETFNFFSKMDIKIYQTNFKNIMLTFNPS
ncbi:TonB family protein [Gammaproteobacteria bacterium]|nr:TonB family protein [Gammaproteobacteria bacterium]